MYERVEVVLEVIGRCVCVCMSTTYACMCNTNILYFDPQCKRLPITHWSHMFEQSTKPTGLILIVRKSLIISWKIQSDRRMHRKVSSNYLRYLKKEKKSISG